MLELTPSTMDESIAKMLSGKDLDDVGIMSVRAHVKWSSLSWKALYQIASDELFLSDKCKGSNGLTFGEYDSVPYFAILYKGEDCTCGVVITASTKSGIARIGYVIHRSGTVSVVKSSSDLTYDNIPAPYKGVAKALKVLADRLLGQREIAVTQETVQAQADKTITLEIALEKSKKAEKKATDRLALLEGAKAKEKDTQTTKQVKK